MRFLLKFQPPWILEYFQLASYSELNEFLKSIERRAFRQAVFAVHNDESALDIVQDAMLRLAEKYSDRPIEELPPLFQRILQNAIRDFYRRQKIRNFWISPLSTLFSGSENSDDQDPLENFFVDADSNQFCDPAKQLAETQHIALIEKALESLPARQREAFLLRYWEDMDVATTAAIMGCSEGSVKTHCSRATHSLAVMLQKKGVEL